MLNISLKNVGNHSEREESINLGKLTLLKGVNGTGKTTVFRAIVWCLYGKGNGLQKKGTERQKMSVTLDFQKYTIYRQRGPGLLTWTDKQTDIVQNDKNVVQRMIDKIFGEFFMWETCSYIKQGGRCIFIDGSKQQKMDFLNRLTLMIQIQRNISTK